MKRIIIATLGPTSLKQDIEKIRENNSEILRIIGRLEGLIER